MLATVHKRPRSVFTSDAEEHTRFRRMLSRPFTFKRVDALRPAVQRITDAHIDAILAGPQPADLVEGLTLRDSLAGDQRDARRAIRRRRILPGAGQQRHEPVRQRRGRGRRRGRVGQVLEEPVARQDGRPQRGSRFRSGRAGEGRGDQRARGRAAGHRHPHRRARDHRGSTQHQHRGAAGESRSAGVVARHRRPEGGRRRRRGTHSVLQHHPDRTAAHRRSRTSRSAAR